LRPNLTPAIPRTLGAVLNSGPDQLALELADRRQYLKHQLSRRRGRIDPGILDGAEANAAAGQLVQDIQEITSRAGKPVQPGDHDYVAVRHLGLELGQLGPLADSPMASASSTAANCEPNRITRSGRSSRSGA